MLHRRDAMIRLGQLAPALCPCPDCSAPRRLGLREHWGMCYTSLLTSGGIEGRQAYGSSDKIAAYPRDNPVAPEDLLATIYHAMGISLESEVRDHENRPLRITDGKPVVALFG